GRMGGLPGERPPAGRGREAASGLARPESPSQGQDQLQIDAPSRTIWSIIEDSARLPAWVPMVGSVDVPEGRREQVGAVRTCDVRMLGRSGQITERCTAMDPGRRVAYTVDHETLG